MSEGFPAAGAAARIRGAARDDPFDGERTARLGSRRVDCHRRCIQCARCNSGKCKARRGPKGNDVNRKAVKRSGDGSTDRDRQDCRHRCSRPGTSRREEVDFFRFVRAVAARNSLFTHRSRQLFMQWHTGRQAAEKSARRRILPERLGIVGEQCCVSTLKPGSFRLSRKFSEFSHAAWLTEAQATPADRVGSHPAGQPSLRNPPATSRRERICAMEISSRARIGLAASWQIEK